MFVVLGVLSKNQGGGAPESSWTDWAALFTFLGFVFFVVILTAPFGFMGATPPSMAPLTWFEGFLAWVGGAPDMVRHPPKKSN